MCVLACVRTLNIDVSNFVFPFCLIIIYSIEQSTSWETKRFPASQEFPRILLIPKVHYRIHKSPPQVFILKDKVVPGWSLSEWFVAWYVLKEKSS